MEWIVFDLFIQISNNASGSFDGHFQPFQAADFKKEQYKVNKQLFHSLTFGQKQGDGEACLTGQLVHASSVPVREPQGDILYGVLVARNCMKLSDSCSADS